MIADAFRRLRRTPAFTALLVLTLGLGIGAATAMYSVVDAVVVAPIPFPHADRLSELVVRYAEGASRAPTSMPDLVRALREQRDLFVAIAGYQFGSGTLTGDGDPELLSVPVLSPEIFAVLPLAPLAGRLPTPADAASSEHLVLVSERFWARRFGRDPRIIGRVLTVDDVPHRVIGVLPARFTLPETRPDLWRVQALDTGPAMARGRMIVMRPAGVSQAQLDERLDALSSSMQSAGVLPPGQSIGAEDPLPVQLGRDGATALYVLLGAVLLLLLVACVNAANLLLVHGASRRGEQALMAALGAGRARLLRDAAIDSMMVSVAGGMVGVWVAAMLLDVILRLAPAQMSLLSRATGDLDLRALLFAFGMTAAACLLCGTIPAWHAGRVDPLDALKQHSRATAGRRDEWWQGALVSTQIALVIVLLAATGLLLRSFISLNQVDLGFNPDRLVALDLQLTAPAYRTPGETLRLIRDVERRVESQLHVPVTISGGSPVRGGGFALAPKPEADGMVPPPAHPSRLPFTRVSGDFFEVYKIPLLQGRTFADADDDDTVILNDLLAQRYFGTVSPIGRRFRTGADRPWMTVIGVAADVKTMGPADPIGDGMEYYVPYPKVPAVFNFVTLTAAVSGSHEQALASIKRIIWELDPRAPIITASSLREQVGLTIARPRFVLSLSAAFAVTAVLIAAVGVYGVSAYWVSRRRRELAIRLALGASPEQVLVAVCVRSVRLVAIGAAVGLAVALGVSRIMTSLLFATDARDPGTFIGVTVFLAVVALMACAGPAIRASRIDPMATLRVE